MKSSVHELGALFEEVQMKNILGDGKTFPDCIPKRSLDEINEEFQLTKANPDFDLTRFVATNFELPKAESTSYSGGKATAREHIEALWEVLTRYPSDELSSQITLPHPYVVPGGRFREIYYWDSYFTMLGLKASGRIDLIQHMINNFVYLIDRYGYIPNGNRTYFLGRSQPPFFSLMVKLLTEAKGQATLEHYLNPLEKEYSFWMSGSKELSNSNRAVKRTVLLPNGVILNRYWDENNTPRPESFKEDIELSHQTHQKPEELFRHLRAAAESGWDFSSRWFKEVHSFASIHTAEIIPVDLNCLLLNLELTLSDTHRQMGSADKSQKYLTLAEQRKKAIQDFCWDGTGFYFDYDYIIAKRKTSKTLAAAFPLFFKVATEQQAANIAATLKEEFLKPGGFTTTPEFSGQQWDAPNGWAPLQWITFRGLLNYGFDELANEAKSRWVTANLKVFEKTGKMTEKYDVWNKNAEASGGEYPNQDGFGWTNGVFLALNSTN